MAAATSEDPSLATTPSTSDVAGFTTCETSDASNDVHSPAM